MVGRYEESVEVQDELADVGGLERRVANDVGGQRGDRLFEPGSMVGSRSRRRRGASATLVNTRCLGSTAVKTSVRANKVSDLPRKRKPC